MGIVGLILVALLVPVFFVKRSVSSKRGSFGSIDKILKHAELSLKKGRASKALALLRPLEAKGIGGLRLKICFARSLSDLGREKEALIKLKAASEEFPNDLVLYKELALVHLALGQYVEAKEAFLQALSVLQGEEEYLGLASACFQSGDFESAWKYVAPFLQGSQNGRLFSLAGDCMFIAKNFSSATSLYRKAVQLGWVNHKLLNRLGHCYRLEKHFQEAEDVFKKLLQQDREDLVAALGLGLCFEMQGYHAKALILYQQEEIWAQGDARIIKRAGICSYKVGKYQAAECYLADGLKSEEPDLLTLGYLASACVRQEKMQIAENYYFMIVDRFPQSYLGYRGLAWLYGVGVSSRLNDKQGVQFALACIRLKGDRISWEVASACFARSGDFQQAHKIQEALAALEETKEMRLRRLQAMRLLRKQCPLASHLVAC